MNADRALDGCLLSSGNCIRAGAHRAQQHNMSDHCGARSPRARQAARGARRPREPSAVRQNVTPASTPRQSGRRGSLGMLAYGAPLLLRLSLLGAAAALLHPAQQRPTPVTESEDGVGGSSRMTGAHRRMAFWWKPANRTKAQDLAMIRSKAHLIDTLYVYCRYTVLPDGSFGVATNQTWFHANWGGRGMCTPEYFAQLTAGVSVTQTTPIKIQLVLSMGDAQIGSYRKAFAFPGPLISGMLRTIQRFDASVVSGWNIDWEPCDKSTLGSVRPTDAVPFARLLNQMKSAHLPYRRTISVDVSQWCNMTMDFPALAAAADSVQDMGTYHADSLENFESKLNFTSGVPRERLWVGLGFGTRMTKFPYETTASGLKERFAALSAAGVLNVAMFELPSAPTLAKWNMSGLWWAALEHWTSTNTSTKTSLKTDDWLVAATPTTTFLAVDETIAFPLYYIDLTENVLVTVGDDQATAKTMKLERSHTLPLDVKIAPTHITTVVFRRSSTTARTTLKIDDEFTLDDRHTHKYIPQRQLLAASAGVTRRHLAFTRGSDWEFAFEFCHDACPNLNPREHIRGDVPDSMPLAWFDRRRNESSLISATSQGIHASTSVGGNLDSLARTDCGRVVFNSSFERTPQSYANHQWLQSVRLLANGSAFGLVHNEFKPELSGSPEYNSTYCPCVLTKSCKGGSSCEMWSTGIAASHDSGRSFQLVAKPPKHVAFTLPHRYTNGQNLAGYGAVGTMLPGGDGMYYGFVNIAGSSRQESGVAAGNCPFRTSDLSDPSTYRGWDGSDYSVRWRSPYLPDGSQGAGKCVTVPTNGTSPFDAHVCLRRFVDGGDNGAAAGFLAVGPHSASGGGGVRYTECAQEGAEAFEHCATGDSARWSALSPDTILSLQSADRWQTVDGYVLYPVLLDHSSPALGEAKARAAMSASAKQMWHEDGDNYALTSLTSQSLWLYFVSSGHNILRRRVHFSTVVPPPPPPPPPPLPAGCASVVVVGAGVAAANGAYERRAARPGASPVFRKDAEHQIYFVNVSGYSAWHLAHEGVAGSVLYSNTNAAAMQAAGGEGGTAVPPSYGWVLGQVDLKSHVCIAPAPAKLYCKGDGEVKGRS